MCRRDGWISLNGAWDFALDADARWSQPGEVAWAGPIEVPFSPETPRSGVAATGYFQACWYRRSVRPPPLGPDERLLLHFGAVDHLATVWVDGAQVATHEGGYTPFTVDLTPLLRGQPLEVVVRAADDPHDLAKPRGKQDWLREPHSIWYPRTSGIWQTVWLERVPPVSIAKLCWASNLMRWEIDASVILQGRFRPGLSLRLRLSVGDLLLADDLCQLTHPELYRRIALSDPGIDDARNALLWSPETPTLIDARIELRDADGRVIDAVDSYTAIRTIGIEGDRIILNGRPIKLRMVLDQGYWPDTGLSAPDDEALRRDVELAKAMGFNGVRKHQKVEDPRYMYWADRLGLMVWGEMPSAYRFTQVSVERLTREWMAVIRRDESHPCIIAWVPFNESWGVPNLPDNPSERHYVQALYHLTKTLDPTLLDARYQSPEIQQNLKTQRFGGRILVIQGHRCDHPLILSEFGGVKLSDEEGTWGYARSATPRQLERRLRALFEVVRQQELFAGYCYTQFADTYQEANGLLHADRTPKFPLERIAALNGVGPREPSHEGS
ncbi:MAG TPA: glycoside hydrolase family 2 TIM barrel-domain containing protein [Nannocystis sp.]